MLNFELPDHPVYDAGELLWFDDDERGTGMLAFLTRRPDRVVDHYVQTGLRLDPVSFHIGGGTRSWNVTDIDPARLEVTADGVLAEARFEDVDGRLVEIHIDDRDGRPRRRAGMLAPVSAGIEVPRSLFAVWMPTFDLVRASGSAVTIRIEGQDVATERIPLERLHGQRVIKYMDTLLAVEVNPDRFADPQPQTQAANRQPRIPHQEPGTNVNDEVVTAADGRTIRAVVAGRDGHRARLLLGADRADPPTAPTLPATAVTVVTSFPAGLPDATPLLVLRDGAV